MRINDSTRKNDCFKSSWRYFLDKGAYLLLISVAPALLIPFLLSPSSTLYYLFDYLTIAPTDLADMIRSMNSLPYDFWYLGIIGIFLLVFFIAIMLGVIDRHMRIGEFTVSPSRVKNRLNFNLLTSLRFCLLTFVFFALTNLLTCVLYYLWWVVFESRTLWLVFSSITLVVVQLFMLLLMTQFILWPPFCLHTGLPAREAMRKAVGSMSGRLAKTMITLITALVPIELAMIITGALHCGTVVEIILDVVAYLYVVPFYIVVMYNLFYEVSGTERMDLVAKSKSIWSKK